MPIPPYNVRKRAALGLALRREFGRGGTAVGIARARDLANGRNVSYSTIQRMYSYFSRHAVDKQGRNFNSEYKPSNGRIAWELWGGDAGFAWVKSIRGDI